MSIVKVTPGKCKLCYACIRACPAKAIKITGGHAEIIEERCINCGSCVNVCAPGALEYKSAKTHVKELVHSDKKVAAIVDPSISGEFIDISDYRNFVGMIKSMGFTYVNDISFGVDLLAEKYKELLSEFKGKYYITSACPVIVSYIEKYYPELIQNLAELLPPWAITAKAVYEMYGADTHIVYIGPCVAEKETSQRFSDSIPVEEVVTFVELRELFEELEISENSVEFSEFDQPIGGKGSLFPISNGILQTVDMEERLLKSDILTTEGKDNILRAIQQFRHSSEMKQHLNLFYCDGCLMGPGTSPGGDKFIRRSRVIDYVKKRLNNFDEATWKKHKDDFSGKDLSREFEADNQRLPFPNEEEIKKELDALGKSVRSEQLGCGACGYPSCREFAVAIKQGLAKREMCTYFSTRKLRAYINEIDKTNKKLSDAQKALKESEQKAKEEHNAAKEALETNKTMLQKLPTAIVLVDENLKITDSNKSFVQIVGDEAKELNEVVPGLVGADLKSLIPFHKYFSSVLMSGEDITNRDVELNEKLVNISIFTIKKNKIVGGIIRDLYSPEVRKDEIINRAKDVIKENLETVQQIAFLLGESASKTEKTLNSIIQSYKTGSDDGTGHGK